MSFFKRILSPFSKIKDAVKKTNQALGGALKKMITFHRKVDKEFLEDLEEILLASDIGPEAAFKLVDRVKNAYRFKEVTDPDKLLGQPDAE